LLDTRLERSAASSFKTRDGGSVEVFANADAEARRTCIEAIVKNVAPLNEHVCVSGPILVRVSTRLTPDQVAGNWDALASGAP